MSVQLYCTTQPDTSHIEHQTTYTVCVYLCYSVKIIYCIFILVFSEKVSDQLSSLIWPISVTSDPWPMCTHYYDEGYVFLVSVPGEKEWYHSIHTSTLLPLYALLMYRHHLGPHSIHGYSIALLPAVENYELQVRA